MKGRKSRNMGGKVETTNDEHAEALEKEGRKHGGAVKKEMKSEGKVVEKTKEAKAKFHLGKLGRKRGGRVGADMAPLSSAGRGDRVGNC